MECINSEKLKLKDRWIVETKKEMFENINSNHKMKIKESVRSTPLFKVEDGVTIYQYVTSKTVLEINFYITPKVKHLSGWHVSS